MQQRQERIKAGGVTEKKVTIDGHSASYLTSPDGSVRSYYVTSGDFHFVTTSNSLAARFLATASGGDSLGKSKEFRHARSIMPIGRNDTIWLYASDAFFRNITSPHYRVEMARRLQSAADIDLVQLARLAAAGEGKPGDTIEQLKSASALPPEFGPLPDGSHIVSTGPTFTTASAAGAGPSCRSSTCPWPTSPGRKSPSTTSSPIIIGRTGAGWTR